MDAPVIFPSYVVLASGPQEVTITSDDPSATIRFTTDGSTPTSSSTLYTGAFEITSSTVINAIAIDTDTSPVATSFIQIDATTENISRENLIIWLKSDNGVITSSSNVTNWIDVSGSGNDASQSDSSSQPTLLTGAINELPAVVFNGSAQFLQFPSGFADFTNGMSIFIVCESTGLTTDYVRVIDFGNGVLNSSVNLCQPDGSTISFQITNSGASQTTVTSSFSQNEYLFLELVFDGTSWATLYTNGVEGAQSRSMYSIDNLTRTGNIGRYTGGGKYFEGQIAELLIYDRGLSDPEIQAIGGYIADRYDLLTAVRPIINPSYSVFSSGPQTVSISLGEPEGTIYFTTSGADPTTDSPVYTEPFNITESTVVKALSVGPNIISQITTSFIQIDSATANVSRDGLIVWVKADNGVVTSSSKVTNWNDVSGNGNDASQPNSSNQPTYLSDAINDLPAVVFSGASQSLQFPGGFADFTDGMSIFIVLEPTGLTADYARIVDFGNGGLNSSINLCQPNGSSFSCQIANSGGSQTDVTSVDITQNIYQLIELIFDGSSTAMLYTDAIQGAQNTSMYSIDDIVRVGNYIGQYSGGGEFFEGQIAELLIYNRQLNSSEKTSLELYLETRYALSGAVAAPLITLPGGTLSAPSQVVISGPFNSVIKYTIDGTDPGLDSTDYDGPILISFGLTLKAIAVVSGMASSVSSETYVLDPIAYPAPVPSDTTTLSINLDLPTVAQ